MVFCIPGKRGAITTSTCFSVLFKKAGSTFSRAFKLTLLASCQVSDIFGCSGHDKFISLFNLYGVFDIGYAFHPAAQF